MIKTVIVYGPTASGKTDLALQLASKFQGELISADSRQVYKGLNIGTGKVQSGHTVVKRSGYWLVDGIKVHGFDLVDPGTQFSAGDFLRFTSAAMFRISAVKKFPIIVGGTGFYIKALIDGLGSIGIPQDSKLRRNLEKQSVTKLFQKLNSIDTKRAVLMNQSDRNNPRRLIRAIEIASSSRQSGTHYQLPTTNYLLIGLTAPNDFLFKRADAWLTFRMENGMIEEVKNLLNQKVSPTWLENLGLEYRWITRYLSGKISRDESLIRLKGDIHSFIRRQKTWFNKFPKIVLYDISKGNWQSKLEKRISLWYTKGDHGRQKRKS